MVCLKILHLMGGPTKSWYPEVDTEKNYQQLRLEGRDKITEMMAKGKNITEMAEERLRRRENLLSEAQKVAKIGHWEWDIKSGAVTWSDEMFILFGYGPGAITPSMDMFMDTVLPKDRERVARVIRQSLDGAGRYFMDRVAVLPDGTERIVHAEGEVDRDESGAPLRMFAVVQDITERKRAELKADSLICRNQVLMRNALEGIHILDDQGNLIEANDSFCRHLGYTMEEALQLSVFDWEAKLTADELRIGMKKYLDGQGVFETVHRRKDGSFIDVEVSLVGVELDGRKYIYCTNRDITERKKLDEELKSSHNLLRALASYLDGAREEERTRIAREVHDEIGQELTRLSIDLFGLTACIKRAHIQEEAQLLEKTDIISEGIGLLAEKVHTIAMELRPGILDQLGLTAAIEWQAGAFQKKNDIQCGFEVKGAVSIDNAASTALFRILQEALTNIVRHANAVEVDIRLWKEDGLVCLEIADNGRGITDKELQSVYSLGLLGMKERARALGGSVDISANISGSSGTGTTVTVRIPARE